MSERRIDLNIPKNLPESLPVLPLRKGVLLPGVISPFAIARRKSLVALNHLPVGGWLLVGVQREPVQDPAPADLLSVATLARVVKQEERDERPHAVALQGVARVRLGEFVQIQPYLEAKFEVMEKPWPKTTDAEAMRRALLSAIQNAAEEFGGEVPIAQVIQGVEDPVLLVDLVAASLETEIEWKLEVLETIDPLARAEKVMEQIGIAQEILRAQKTIRDRVITDLRGAEREAILRRQLKAIQDELGEKDPQSDVDRIKEKLEDRDLPDEVREVVDREISRLERMQNGSAERSVAVDWLEWIADLPWGSFSSTEIDLAALEKVLDETHYGLDDVKRQVVEHLAVRKLAGKGRADVLLLVGPPGVGKTSIAEAIAKATERKLVRVALGGVRDEAELRGHRRTYVGARPGRLIEGLRRAGTADPVVLLDEVDKLGRGWQGDPASALLEILDPEQNHHFVDHYLEVPFDLSRVLFIATANDLSTVPPPLRDRMEMLEIEGYTPNEKVIIAKEHVLKKLAQNAGLSDSDVHFTDAAIEDAIAGWTREAGVRQLQRVLGKVFRAAAVKKAKSELGSPLEVDRGDLKGYLGRRKFQEEKHELTERPGVATGLAWTPLGGDVLYVEASLIPGGSGKLVLTGQLGDVMKESAQAALTYVRSVGGKLGFADDVLKGKDLHVHVPAGATPKDGPSAGVTMFSAIASLLSGRPVRSDLAMTGEVTLRGRVLPVGGIKSKVLAAHARGLKSVVLPKRNEADLDELPEAVRKELNIVLVEDMEEVLQAGLTESTPTIPLAVAEAAGTAADLPSL
jgi:ATP-dependent Lon protease